MRPCCEYSLTPVPADVQIVVPNPTIILPSLTPLDSEPPNEPQSLEHGPGVDFETKITLPGQYVLVQGTEDLNQKRKSKCI